MHVYVVGSATHFYPHPMGAVERYVYGLSKQLSSMADVTTAGFGQGVEESEHFSLKTFDSVAFRTLWKIPVDAVKGIACASIHSAHILKHIFEVNKKNRIDIIHLNTIYSIPMAMVCKLTLGIPFVCSLHNEVVTAGPLYFCDRILTVSNYLRVFLKQNRGFSKDVDVLYDGVHTDSCDSLPDAEASKRELGLSSRKVIMFVGRKTFVKGPQVLIDALPNIVKKHPEAIAVFIGPDYRFGSKSTSYTDMLLTKAKSHGVAENVVFKGYVSEGDLKLYYAAADVFVCPSVWNEPFGMVLIEALCYNKAVVASNVGGIPEIVKDKETGLLVAPNDSDELGNAVILLLNDETLRRKLGANGRRDVEERFDFKVIAKNCMDIYQKVLSQSINKHKHN